LLLYHYPASPFCRKARLALSESGYEFSLRLEKTWLPNPDFLRINPAGEVPVLVTGDDKTIIGHQVICEYLVETLEEQSLIYGPPAQAAEIRRMVAWCDDKFVREVGRSILYERMIKRLKSSAVPPDSRAIKAGRTHLDTHLLYFSWLLERRQWLAATTSISLADMAAASHISLLDYLGEIKWDRHKELKLWYYRVKSRRSFAPLLTETIPGFEPAPTYGTLDF